MAAINPVTYPNNRNCFLLLPLHHQLHRTELDHNVLLQHIIPAHLVLLARTALAAHLHPHNLHENAGWMDGLLRHHCLSCRPHLKIIEKRGRGRHIQRGHGRNDLLHRCAHRRKRDVVRHTLAAISHGLIDDSDGGAFFFPCALSAATARVGMALSDATAREGVVPSRRCNELAVMALNPWLCLCCAGYFLFHVNKVHQCAYCYAYRRNDGILGIAGKLLMRRDNP